MKSEKPFQKRISDALAQSMLMHLAANRSEGLSAPLGCVLEAPTGVGKTFITIKALNKFSARNKVVWFWFSPWAHLAEQTGQALSTDAVNLAVSDLEYERSSESLSESRIYPLVWASVAAKDEKSRRRRVADDGKQNLADFISECKAAGYAIGVVVDEAHHQLKAGSEAVRLLAETIKPELYIFVSATPDDEELAQAAAALSLTHLTYFRASRAEGVSEKLIKPCVDVFYWNKPDGEASAIQGELKSLEQETVLAALSHHRKIVTSIQSLNPVPALVPLMLIQVGSGEETMTSDEVSALLVANGVPASAIRVHTADSPDKEFQSISSDTSVQFLIFKMSVATGFDAPRAFTLASLRGSRKEAFGIQLLGRILRFPSELRAYSELPRILTAGAVFFLDKDSQEGLSLAAESLKEIQAEIASARIVSRVRQGYPGEKGEAPDELPLYRYPSRFPEYGENYAVQSQSCTKQCLDFEGLEARILEDIELTEDIIELVISKEFRRNLAQREVFTGDLQKAGHQSVQKFNLQDVTSAGLRGLNSICELDLRAFLNLFLKHPDFGSRLGLSEEDRTLAAYLIASQNPSQIQKIVRRLQKPSVHEHTVTPFVNFASQEKLRAGLNNVFGVRLPATDFDSPDEEQFCVDKLENEDAPIEWWHRNPSKKSCGIGIAVLSEARTFYPDFLVKLQEILLPTLVEVKGEGWLRSTKVTEDMQVVHPTFGKPIFVVQIKNVWHFVEIQSGLPAVSGKFSWKALKNKLQSES